MSQVLAEAPGGLQELGVGRSLAATASTNDPGADHRGGYDALAKRDLWLSPKREQYRGAQGITEFSTATAWTSPGRLAQ